MQRVFLDTCVLYPAHFRDTIPRLAEADLIQPLWSREILAELRRNLSARQPGDDSVLAKVDRLISTLNGFFSDALVDFEVRPIGEGLPELLHPDTFLLDMLDLAPGQVIRLLYRQVAEHKRPPQHIQGLLDVLDRSGVPGFAAEVRRRLD
ncbi:PIN domain-containing protein [Nocardia miyunensis]|uniref:PIN domain-containing protein n=1 Tax=Nocardia miyunensis TaxID=282684 RepID=UPI0008337F7A|nr:PIN domain-containing protein [Nocardia miyunensis]